MPTHPLVPDVSIATWVHLTAALVSVVLGAWQLLVRRARTRHRFVGYAWVIAMTVTAVSSFWLTSPLGFASLGGLSWIHGLSVWTLVSLAVAIAMIRAGRVAEHRRWMTSSFVGLLVAGVFAAASPGRVLNTLIVASAPQLLALGAR